MAEAILAALDGIQGLAWHAGFRFQWPCWLLAWALDRQAAEDERAVAAAGFGVKGGEP